jgi:hypothetical protein
MASQRNWSVPKGMPHSSPIARHCMPHMWTASSSQGILQCFDQIACVHMSGLLMRSHMNAGQDGFRGTSSKQKCGLVVVAITAIGVSRLEDRLITPSAHYLARRPRLTDRRAASIAVPSSTAPASLSAAWRQWAHCHARHP